MTETIRTATNGFGQCHAVDEKGRSVCGMVLSHGGWAVGHKPAEAVTCAQCRAMLKKGEGHGD